MTEKQCKKLITRYLKKWKQALYLGTWDIDITYVDITYMSHHADDPRAIANTKANYQYMNAYIEFYIDTIVKANLDEETIEQYVLHELVHCALSGHQSVVDHDNAFQVGTIERETQLLTYALLSLDRRDK